VYNTLKVSAVETAHRQSFPQELTQKPDQIRTALDFHVAIANLIRYTLEDYETQESGILIFRARKIQCPLGEYNFRGPSIVVFPIKNVDLEQTPKPLWEFLNGGYFNRGEPLNLTALFTTGLNNHTSVLAISDNASRTRPKQIEARVKNPGSLQFTKGAENRGRYNSQQALTIAGQMVDLAFEAADHIKVSKLAQNT